MDKLGFEVRAENRMDNGFRWLTVGPKSQPSCKIILMKIETAASLRLLLERGILCGGVQETSDCRRDYEDLKAKGVELILWHRGRHERKLGDWYNLAERKGN